MTFKNSLLLLTVLLVSCVPKEAEEHSHGAPTHNFSVTRLIILNENNEMLMGREDYVWAPPGAMFNQRQFINEELDSLALTYGVEIDDVELRGYFAYKYDYHPYATTRAYYVAKYKGGTPKATAPTEEVKWLPMEEALDISTVTSIRQSTMQILDYPNTVWGGSFMVSRTDTSHPTVIVEPFYPLFEK